MWTEDLHRMCSLESRLNLADASLFLMNNYNDSSIINVGTGEDVTIKELAEKIKNVVGYDGEISWDTSKPDGTPRSFLDVEKLHKFLGWNTAFHLITEFLLTYEWFTVSQK